MKVKIISTILIFSLIFLCTTVLKRKLIHLQKQKQCELDTLDNRDKIGKNYAFAEIRPTTTAEIRPTTTKLYSETAGLVKGIIYSENKASTIISEENKILYESNTIYGAKIVKIHKDKVEFAKNGQRWTQKVGEAPGPEWHQ
ncbi:MAG: hypothetical protein GY845_06415 [Planctomycetes bacterium]|nr:hypothetical protein [Planctomycetota bacterium]